MKKPRLLNPRCELCGKFTSWAADSATYYGSVLDMEPPDPHYFCDKCAQECKEKQLKSGQPYQGYWIDPAWNRVVANRLGFVKKDYRWVKADTIGA